MAILGLEQQWTTRVQEQCHLLLPPGASDLELAIFNEGPSTSVRSDADDDDGLFTSRFRRNWNAEALAQAVCTEPCFSDPKEQTKSKDLAPPAPISIASVLPVSSSIWALAMRNVTHGCMP